LFVRHQAGGPFARCGLAFCHLDEATFADGTHPVDIALQRRACYVHSSC
jgi:hypothetical protein